MSVFKIVKEKGIFYLVIFAGIISSVKMQGAKRLFDKINILGLKLF